MKKITPSIYSILYIILIGLYTVLPAETKVALTGDELLKNIDKNFTVKTSASIVKMKTIKNGKVVRSYKMKLFTKEKLAKYIYIEPAILEGNIILKNKDGIFMYSAMTERTRKLGSIAESMDDSDFSAEDIGEKKLAGNYKCSITKEDKDYYYATLIPLKKSPYTKIIGIIRKSDYYPSKLDYYKGNSKVKIMTVNAKDIKSISGIKTAMKVTMKNLEKKRTTILEIEKIDYDIKLEDNFFAKENITKGSE